MNDSKENEELKKIFGKDYNHLFKKVNVKLNEPKKNHKYELNQDMIDIFRSTLTEEKHREKKREMIARIKSPEFKKHFYRIATGSELKRKSSFFGEIIKSIKNFLRTCFTFVFFHKKWKIQKMLERASKKMVAVGDAADEYAAKNTLAFKIVRINELNTMTQEELTDFLKKDIE